ncbi:MAG: 2-phosphosulfolactate phosphatase [Aminobacterium sp.]|jgi:2-phosphosulfolactate phosphatase|nr:2-phosphosulfolactate phosphatase [Aminobacterium sp.]MDD3426141.1 2-phosphosulfolactate phosphatase [Aminobacterium sp.]MDD3708343.1 2-phosphosulfolactate phosphatase [Aminobacterium sp.]MDD4228534.1 2-phosphosulfolactate phosphatase [Aminobacterium sp.]MDD4551490.1 2-phosphosulfolactate phosphatase [Aminobacterium sp.]
MKRIDVVLSPAEELPEADGWLVIDILRASTTITTFFDNGGTELFPVATLEEAFRLKKERGEATLLMGERNALSPEGFDLGNSPLDLSKELLARRPSGVMTTTNGTLALQKAAETGVPVWVACGRNATAAIEKLWKSGTELAILCAGRYGRLAFDDGACAGMLVHMLQKKDSSLVLRDGASTALAMWNYAERDLLNALNKAEHAKSLYELNMESDILFASQIDVTRTVACLYKSEALVLRRDCDDPI